MEQIVKNFIEELDYDSSVIDEKHESRVKDWLTWYQGKTKYHNYYLYNGKKKVTFYFLLLYMRISKLQISILMTEYNFFFVDLFAPSICPAR